MPRHVQEIVRLKGGNEYEEGRKAFTLNVTGLALALRAHGQVIAIYSRKGQVKECSLPPATMADEWESDTEDDLHIGDSDERVSLIDAVTILCNLQSTWGVDGSLSSCGLPKKVAEFSWHATTFEPRLRKYGVRSTTYTN
jgi:hypothetical protein